MCSAFIADRSYVLPIGTDRAMRGRAKDLSFLGVVGAEFRPDFNWESLKISPPDGRRPAGEPILMFPGLESSRHPARKADFRPGSIIA